MPEILLHRSGHADALTNEVAQLRRSLSQEKAKVHAERRKGAAQLASIQKRLLLRFENSIRHTVYSPAESILMLQFDTNMFGI